VFLDWRHRLRLWLQVLASEALGLFPIGLVLLRGVPVVPTGRWAMSALQPARRFGLLVAKPA
jgi:hypothetical protein